MSASVSITVNIPTSEKKAHEVMWIHRALLLAANDIRAGGGGKTSGNIISDGSNIGSWTYSAGASS